MTVRIDPKVIFVALFVVAILNVAGQEPDTSPRAIRLLAVDGTLSRGKAGVVERLGGESVEIPLLLSAKPAQAPQIAADVYLDAGSLGVPLHKNVELKPTRDPMQETLWEGILSLPRMEENQKTLLLRVVLRSRADELASWLPLGQFQLRMVPQIELKKALAIFDDASGNNDKYKLGVFGTAKGLREMLKARKIPFEDFGKELPVRIEPRMLVVGEVADASQALLPTPTLEEGAGLLLLSMGSPEVVSINEKNTNGRILTVVNAAGVEDWRHSAFLQRLLTKQIQQYQSKP